MDHHGLLNTLRALTITCRTVQEARATQQPEWSWVHTPVIMPESRCVYCKAAIRSNGVWFLGSAPSYNRLYGMLKIVQGGKVVMIQPSHPHDTSGGGGSLCIGRHPNGISLLAGEPNLGDCPMGRHRVPMWYKRYWNHDCPEMRKYLEEWGETAMIRELDRL